MNPPMGPPPPPARAPLRASCLGCARSRTFPHPKLTHSSTEDRSNRDHYRTSRWEKKERGKFRIFARAGFCSNERTSGGDAGAEHGCGQLGRNIIWNEECKIFVGPDMARISSLGDCTVGVWCVIRIWYGGKYKSIE